MAVQTTYNETMVAGRAGAIVNTEPRTLISRTVEDAAGVALGLVVQQGAADDGCTAVLTGMTASTYVGVTVLDRSRPAADAPDTFGQYESARIMRSGVVWVTASGAVAAGDDATVTLATGAIGTAAVAAGVIAIPDARWDSSAADGEIAKLRLAS
jgi:hypothetical protein